MEILSSLKGGYQTWLASLAEINGLTINQLEKITEKQIDSTKYFTGLGIQHLKTLQGVSSVDGLKALTRESVSLTGNITKKLIEDGQEGVALGNEYKEKLIAIFKENANNANKSSKKQASVK
jgi:phasin family protein